MVGRKPRPREISMPLCNFLIWQPLPGQKNGQGEL